MDSPQLQAIRLNISATDTALSALIQKADKVILSGQDENIQIMCDELVRAKTKISQIQTYIANAGPIENAVIIQKEIEALQNKSSTVALKITDAKKAQLKKQIAELQLSVQNTTNAINSAEAAINQLKSTNPTSPEIPTRVTNCNTLKTQLIDISKRIDLKSAELKAVGDESVKLASNAQAPVESIQIKRLIWLIEIFLKDYEKAKAELVRIASHNGQDLLDVERNSILLIMDSINLSNINNLESLIMSNEKLKAFVTAVKNLKVFFISQIEIEKNNFEHLLNLLVLAILIGIMRDKWQRVVIAIIAINVVLKAQQTEGQAINMLIESAKIDNTISIDIDIIAQKKIIAFLVSSAPVSANWVNAELALHNVDSFLKEDEDEKTAYGIPLQKQKLNTCGTILYQFYSKRGLHHTIKLKEMLRLCSISFIIYGGASLITFPYNTHIDLKSTLNNQIKYAMIKEDINNIDVLEDKEIFYGIDNVPNCILEETAERLGKAGIKVEGNDVQNFAKSLSFSKDLWEDKVIKLLMTVNSSMVNGGLKDVILAVNNNQVVIKDDLYTLAQYIVKTGGMRLKGTIFAHNIDLLLEQSKKGGVFTLDECHPAMIQLKAMGVINKNGDKWTLSVDRINEIIDVLETLNSGGKGGGRIAAMVAGFYIIEELQSNQIFKAYKLWHEAKILDEYDAWVKGQAKDVQHQAPHINKSFLYRLETFSILIRANLDRMQTIYEASKLKDSLRADLGIYGSAKLYCIKHLDRLSIKNNWFFVRPIDLIYLLYQEVLHERKVFGLLKLIGIALLIPTLYYMGVIYLLAQSIIFIHQAFLVNTSLFCLFMAFLSFFGPGLLQLALAIIPSIFNLLYRLTLFYFIFKPR